MSAPLAGSQSARWHGCERPHNLPTLTRTCVYALSSCGLMCPCLQYLAAEKVNRESGSSSVNALNTLSSSWDLVDRNSWAMLLWV